MPSYVRLSGSSFSSVTLSLLALTEQDYKQSTPSEIQASSLLFSSAEVHLITLDPSSVAVLKEMV